MPTADNIANVPEGAVELPRVLDLKAAAPLTAEFLALRGMPVDVDASRVDRLGAQCLQVLLSAAKTWRTDEVHFALVNPSSGFSEGLDRLGVYAADFSSQDRPQ